MNALSGIFGIGASNIEGRSKATNHELDETPIKFEACQSLPNGGVLFLLPFLAETGLFSFRGHYFIWYDDLLFNVTQYPGEFNNLTTNRKRQIFRLS